jgi:hypothetical protein
MAFNIYDVKKVGRLLFYVFFQYNLQYMLCIENILHLPAFISTILSSYIFGFIT